MRDQPLAETPLSTRAEQTPARLSRLDMLALLVSLLAVLIAYGVAARVFELMPHLEDEVAYVWEAKLAASGRLTIPTPEYPKSFLVPFVVDYNGLRFGKYPLGWPVVLAAGMMLGVRAWVNPLLAGFGVWLTYRLGKKVFSAGVGLLAAGLTVVSPFFLVNSGSLLSHPLGLALSAAFTLVWLDGFGDRNAPRRWLPTLTAAGLMGALVLTRPMTAAAVAFPFAIHGLVLLIRGPRQTRLHLLVFGLTAAALASLHLLWQYAVTGDPMLNPYTLWWPYDKIGFGPEVGRHGHTLTQAWINTRQSLAAGWKDLFGWGTFSWILLPVGAWAALRNWRGWLVAGVFPSTVLFYLAYWIGSSLFGPRYYYEGLFSLTLITAAGVFWLAGAYRRDAIDLSGLARRVTARFLKKTTADTDAPLPIHRAAMRSWLRPGLAAVLLIALVSYNLAVYLPARLAGMYGLYDMRREQWAPFLTPEAQALTPALIIVHSDRWMRYGALIDLENPDLTSPFIFAWSQNTNKDSALAVDYYRKGWNVFHYYVDYPGEFYDSAEPAKEP